MHKLFNIHLDNREIMKNFSNFIFALNFWKNFIFEGECPLCILFKTVMLLRLNILRYDIGGSALYF